MFAEIANNNLPSSLAVEAEVINVWDKRNHCCCYSKLNIQNKRINKIYK